MMHFKYDYSMNLSKSRESREKIQYAQAIKGFGRTTHRFGFDTVNENPGVGSYSPNANQTSMIIKSPSHSAKGFGNVFSMNKHKIQPPPERGIPGPNSYHIRSFSDLPSDEFLRPSTPFIASGKGRVPFPKPNKYPGPADYVINFDPGVSPILKNKASATFSSKTNRESFVQFNHDTPNVGKYNLGDPPASPSHDLQWSKSSYKRFQELGQDNQVPPPTIYFDERKKPIKKSLRQVGNFRGKLLGKQNETTKQIIHTFGADKDRFKHSIFGRLDQKALIPGPGAYGEEILYTYGRKSPESGTRSRASTAPAEQSRIGSRTGPRRVTRTPSASPSRVQTPAVNTDRPVTVNIEGTRNLGKKIHEDYY